MSGSDVLSDELGAVPTASSDYRMVPVLRSALRAPDQVSLDADWETYSAHVSAGGLSDEIRRLAESSEGVFAVRQAWLAGVEPRGVVNRRTSRLRPPNLRQERDRLVEEVTRRSSVARGGFPRQL